MPSNDPTGAGDQIAQILLEVILFLPLLVAAFLARWNVVRGKGDRSGALRLAALIFVLHLALWAFRAHLSSVENFLFLLILGISTALFWGAAVWVLYLALEPYVRRFWPQAIITWTRVLGGRWRDPLVGRDVLYGVVLGAFVCDLYGLRFHLEALFGAPPSSAAADYLSGARSGIAAWLLNIPASISFTLLSFLILFLCRVLLRKSWLGAIAFVLLFAAARAVLSPYPAIEWPMQMILYGALASAALRFGLVTFAVALYVGNLALNIPLTLNPSAWYFTPSTLALATIAALAIWGFYTALAGQWPWATES